MLVVGTCVGVVVDTVVVVVVVLRLVISAGGRSVPGRGVGKSNSKVAPV